MKAMMMIGIGWLCMSNLAFAASCPDILKGSQRKLNSTDTVNLCEAFQGKTLLVVNTASQCGFTSQFDQLETLYQQYKDQDFAVIGFPSNDFNQDRGGEEASAKVCYLDYGVTFPMMARSNVRGNGANPVFAEITRQAGVEPRWNFYKYLINPNGDVVATFPSSVSPLSPNLLSVIKKQFNDVL
ncbi:glutathione peroxidase [Enterovibrio norvegicus]|uniref:Glutathione peroxidase n=2 Tax=Enterovibrio norvegicus TaxID=188144 RepID=A0A1I5T345_9GAMM|nr:glutathione peroxidase [Enterovibrio norvegicus]OEE43194.1 glutathione peroxidase [Enterovibrio norvegicus]OEF48842.1 glutathione peroxidase [Enterovibrio norvegicus]OEF53846.1 glutathione peroxidase [Enterovibrio norvegicus]PMH66273.1 glutathione peroxidase [Enterovibrio norvegicus]TKF16489.1 glutathione peroxidase [Enterovibrio norvegicus]